VRRRRSPARSVVLAAIVPALLLLATACGQREVRGESSAPPQVSKVTPEQVREWMDAGVPLVILDSRAGYAWDSATTKAAGAIRVPPDDVEPYLSKIPRDRRIIVYCT
jgi:hypothetical protein